ncbi:MAG: helix-turn-helix domain-containing protein, partial [Betaproteobacteria bacterium]|nr:helix-turn-helix domain-containing protein [Betaproteobacteria bacterium]
MLADRLKKAMEAANVSQAELARACGVKPPSVHAWMSGEAKSLRGQNLLIAAERLGVSEAWLSSGRGQMKTQQGQAMGAAGTMQSIPLITWTKILDYIEAEGRYTFNDDQEYLPKPPCAAGPKSYAVMMLGDSMAAPGGYEEGDYLYVDPDAAPTSGRDVIVHMNGVLTLRRFKTDPEG